MHRLRRYLALSPAVVLSALIAWHMATAGTHTVIASARPSTLPGIENFGVVEDGVYRGAQPDETGYRTLKKMGVRYVLNLRSGHDERAAVEASGMKPLEVPMGMVGGVSEEKVERAVALMSDPANRPIYVHCRLGQDRTGVVVAMYRIEADGWTLKDAEAEMQTFGFNDIWVNLKHLLHKMAGKDGRGGVSNAQGVQKD